MKSHSGFHLRNFPMHLRGVRLRQHYHMDAKAQGTEKPSITINSQTSQLAFGK